MMDKHSWVKTFSTEEMVIEEKSVIELTVILECRVGLTNAPMSCFFVFLYFHMPDYITFASNHFTIVLMTKIMPFKCLDLCYTFIQR